MPRWIACFTRPGINEIAKQLYLPANGSWFRIVKAEKRKRRKKKRIAWTGRTEFRFCNGFCNAARIICLLFCLFAPSLREFPSNREPFGNCSLARNFYERTFSRRGTFCKFHLHRNQRDRDRERDREREQIRKRFEKIFIEGICIAFLKKNYRMSLQKRKEGDCYVKKGKLKVRNNFFVLWLRFRGSQLRSFFEYACT